MMTNQPDRKKRILIVDDDRSVHIAVKYTLKHSYDCTSAYNTDEASVFLKKQSFDLTLLDIHMRSPLEGLKALPLLKKLDPEMDIIMCSGNNEISLAIQAIQQGASAYLVKEYSPEQLQITIESVLSKRKMLHQNLHHEADRKRLLEKNKLIGQSPTIKKLFSDIEKIRKTQANVIIYGETGTGKELIARHIGSIESKPFVPVDSATIIGTMAESILFGHEKGAFTGAHARTNGLFTEADGGTIYFDEIENMSLEIQSKLLRVLEEKEVTRLGSTKPIPLDFRVICATNKDLEKLSVEGKFKFDLYQRLNVIHLYVPPLRERQEDIPLLVKHFLNLHRHNLSPQAFTDDALDCLQKYSWPGNIRELSNLIANLCTLITDQEKITLADLPLKIRQQTLNEADATLSPSVDTIIPNNFYEHMHKIEGEVLKNLYTHFKGNISKMSKTLKINRPHLYTKLMDHKIHQARDYS